MQLAALAAHERRYEEQVEKEKRVGMRRHVRQEGQRKATRDAHMISLARTTSFISHSKQGRAEGMEACMDGK